MSRTSAVAAVRIQAENGDWTVLLGGRSGTTPLTVGRTDLAGDPGERRALVVRADAAPDPAVVVGQRYEGVALCQGVPALFDRQVVDPQSLTLRPAPADPASAPAETLQAVVSTAPAAPPFFSFTAVGSSELDPDLRWPRRPRALVDGRHDSPWTAPLGGWAVLRWSADAPIETLGFSLAAGAQAPSELLILAEDAGFRVALPAQDGHAGRSFEVTFPRALAGHCLALVATAAADPAQPVAIAEIWAKTQLDRSGLDDLISALIQDGPTAAQAARQLARIGAPAALAVAARFDALSPTGRARALAVLRTGVAAAPVRQRLVELAREDGQALRTGALAALARAGAPGKAALRGLAREPSDAGDAAAELLAGDPTEVPGLLAALAQPSGSDRPRLRRALAAVARRHPERFAQAVSAWLSQQPPQSAQIALALAACAADHKELASALLVHNAPRAARFADRYRAALAARDAGAAPALDQWLAQQTGADEWMMRHAAYMALAQRDRAQALALAPRLAEDPYPRVRAQVALDLLDAAGRGATETLARDDRWPLVRAAAAEGLAGTSASRPTLVRLLDDPSRLVRRAAISALAKQKAPEAWPAIVKRLSIAREAVEVKLAAVQFARNLCVRDARAVLVALVRASRLPDADPGTRQVGFEALKALYALGGEAAHDAQQLAARDPLPARVQEALRITAQRGCTDPSAGDRPD